MKIARFEMERFQSTWETTVAYNLSESGIQPLSLAALVDHTWVQEVLAHQPLGYGHTNGSPELRGEIAGLYHGAGPENVLVTAGTAEANFLVAWSLLDPGDEAVVMLPNYMQLPLLAQAWSGLVREWWLHRTDGGWVADVDELAGAVTPRTKAIFLCHPNNPTGAVFSVETLNAVCAVADRVGAWVVADEVYRGAERDGPATPSFWGRYPRTVVTGGLSKAYGLPGLRIGWIVAPPDVVHTCWAYHDFTTIAPAVLSDRLALMALLPRTRQRLQARTRRILTENFGVLSSWMEGLAEELSWHPPQAGAIAFVQYRAAINSTVLAERLRREQDVLVVPGDHFQMDGYLRIGFGMERRTLEEGLARTAALLRGL
ncbi:MAG: aminotransferase class I/II-fold pyridoxal phosphate-dependent enzyme [Armatimonadota bacterium]|nr:aminotransferase class I/II-fold pyridoxal phosphate-dependent enzyme [Armatimonadota bacterium]MDR7452088.1 aminotransferase class I/II-fold pyridoxal phosphate-dependent enzyme [Armatimonadota bacterium]MDR7466550.1 aminotransferase class I/II-fold pyridoxal phosphate-dependent enzyme [Armatimonadota bacterium]MDR7493272.1 aminotransferase class I/II-fold pyridoxal phosphate-dependent enzyme [Armatimonadota bacterium]MDR7499835.1 aminotransferase class I/II-fold pyridoxal phosphate-depende